MSRYLSHFSKIDDALLKMPADECGPCIICEENALPYLRQSIRKGMGNLKLCKKHELELALKSFPNYNSKEKQVPRRKACGARSQKLTNEENEFLEKYFYQYGVKESEIKKYCKGMTIKRFISDLKTDFDELRSQEGDPDRFAHAFYIGGMFPPFERVDIFLVSLKDSIQTHKDWCR